MAEYFYFLALYAMIGLCRTEVTDQRLVTLIPIISEKKAIVINYQVKFKLKVLVQERNISLRELARLTEIEPAIINKMANNKRNSVYFEHLERIAKALSLNSVTDIIDFEITKD